jgi:hypothetical protein
MARPAMDSVNMASKRPYSTLAASQHSRGKTKISCVAIFPDFYDTLSQLTGTYRNFFSWTAHLPRTYRDLFCTIYRDLYREICREYICDFATIRTQILPPLHPFPFHVVFVKR